jgi:uncharacterized membrane protein YgcG
VYKRQGIQNEFLVGDSYWFLLFFFYTIMTPVLYILGRNWGKLNQKGLELHKLGAGYRYYISKVESQKLDFSNNLDEGVQFYLKNVAYAAMFGVLPKFNKYMQGLIPNNLEIEGVNSVSNGLLSATFYTPPTSSDGGFLGDGGFSGGGGSW